MPSEEDREPRPQATCIKIWCSPAMWLFSYMSVQADKQTDILITILHTPPGAK